MLNPPNKKFENTPLVSKSSKESLGSVIMCVDFVHHRHYYVGN